MEKLSQKYMNLDTPVSFCSEVANLIRPRRPVTAWQNIGWTMYKLDNNM
jgi:hypothetical protein